MASYDSAQTDVCLRQRKAPVEALQGLLNEMEEAGTQTVCLGAAQCSREAVRAADDAVPGGTTRLAKVEADPALEASSPGLDVVLSKCLDLTILTL